jgi:integrase
MVGRKRQKPRREKLTKRVVDAAKPLAVPKDRKFAPDLAIWDTETKGFGVIVKPGGTKTFVLSYRSRQGKQRRLTLGHYGDLSVAKARELAVREKGKVIEGEDPSRERRETRRLAQEALSVAELCQLYLERHARVHKRSWREDERRIGKHVLPALGDLTADEVTQQQVRQLYQSIGRDHPFEANRVLALVSVLFSWAYDDQILDRQDNPARLPRRLRFKESGRDRPITSAELPRLLKAINEHANVYRRSLWLLILVTGLRKTEWLEASWKNIDLQRATLRLPETKSGTPRHVPLSSAALKILRELRSHRMPGNPHVFPSPRIPGEPMRNPKLHWHRVRKEAGCPGLRVHDLRHSVATWLAESGEPAQVIQQALGHADVEMALHYVHQGDQRARNALEGIGRKILEGDPNG